MATAPTIPTATAPAPAGSLFVCVRVHARPLTVNLSQAHDRHTVNAGYGQAGIGKRQGSQTGRLSFPLSQCAHPPSLAPPPYAHTGLPSSMRPPPHFVSVCECKEHVREGAGRESLG